LHFFTVFAKAKTRANRLAHPGGSVIDEGDADGERGRGSNAPFMLQTNVKRTRQSRPRTGNRCRALAPSLAAPDISASVRVKRSLEWSPGLKPGAGCGKCRSETGNNTKIY